MNTSHGKMAVFVSFALFGFTLVIKLVNFDSESHWSTLTFLIKKTRRQISIYRSHRKMCFFSISVVSVVPFFVFVFFFFCLICIFWHYNKQIFHAFLFNIRNHSPMVINIQRRESKLSIILPRVNNFDIKQKKARNIFSITCHQYQTRSGKLITIKTQQILVKTQVFL